mgnify:CR=1 FL=1
MHALFCEGREEIELPLLRMRALSQWLLALLLLALLLTGHALSFNDVEEDVEMDAEEETDEDSLFLFDEIDMDGSEEEEEDVEDVELPEFDEDDELEGVWSAFFFF